MKGKQKHKMSFSVMATSPQSGPEHDQKRKKSVKQSEKIAQVKTSTDSDNELVDTCNGKETLYPKSGKTEFSEVKHQQWSAKISEARKKGKVPEKEQSTKKQYSVLHRKTAVSVDSDEDTSERPSHKSKKKLETEETESEEESTSDESETDIPKHKENVTPKSFTHTEEMYHDSDEEIEKVRAKENNKMPKVATAKSERLVEEEQYKQKKGKRNGDMKEQGRKSELQAKASREKLRKPHSQLKERERVKETDSGMKAKRLVAHSSEQASDESETDSENKESDSGNDSSEDGEDSEGKYSDEEEKTETDEESSTAPSEEEVKKETSLFHKKVKAKKKAIEDDKEKRVSKYALDKYKYGSPQGGGLYVTCTRKVKRKGKREDASLKYEDDKQSDPGHGSRDQEEQQKKTNKKRQRLNESNESPTVIRSSSPSSSQEEKKEQPIHKKQGHRKKHVRKMKEKREKMKRGKEKTSDTDDSSPECDMTNNQYEGEKKELVNIFERFFGKLCCVVFDPTKVTAELQNVGLISKSVMREMMLSPESQQTKIIALVDALDEKIKSHPACLFEIIKVMLEIEALQEIAREMLRETGLQCFCSHCTLF